MAKIYESNVEKFWHLQMNIFCHFKFCHNRRNGVWVLLCSQLTNAWHDKHKISIETIDDEHHLKLKKTIQKYAGLFLYKHFIPWLFSSTRSWLNQKLWCKIQIDYEYTNLFDPFNCCCTFSLQEVNHSYIFFCKHKNKFHRIVFTPLGFRKSIKFIYFSSWFELKIYLTIL